MNISLTPQLESFVRKKVDTGLYNSASEVMREALRLLESYDRLREERLETLRKDIREGIKQADKGELIYGSVVFDELRNLRKT